MREPQGLILIVITCLSLTLYVTISVDGGMIHYLLNCFALFYIGRAVEHSHGTRSTAIVFIVPSVGSVIMSSIFLPQYISVGASGGEH